MSDVATTGEGNPPASFDIDGMPSEVAGALLRGETSLPGVKPTPPPEPAQPPPTPEPQPADTKPEGETPPAEESEPDAPEGDHLPKYRLRPADHLEAEVFRLRKEGVPLKEAYTRVYGEPKPAPTPEKPPQPEAPPEPDPFLAEEEKVKAELTALEKQADKAAEDVDVKESIRIAREMARREMALKSISDRREAAQREAESRKQAEAEAVIVSKERTDFQATVEKFPFLANPKDPRRVKFEAFKDERANDPDYAGFFDTPYWRSALAREFAEREGISPAGKTPPPAAPPSTPKAPPLVPVAPRTPHASQVLTSREAQPSGSSFEITPEQAARDIEEIKDPAVLTALLTGRMPVAKARR